MDYTIANDYTLPSEGKVYGREINPHFKLRSMTTAEEMKRLNHSDRQHKNMSEIIDDCLVESIGISAYDLCVADYQYMLHKLRIVTYGPTYKLESTCPYCGCVNKDELNLEELRVVPFDEEEFKKCTEFVLPATGKHIKLKVQTPRLLDEITYRAKEERRRNPAFVGDPAFLFTIESLIDTIDGNVPEKFKLTPFVQKLPMMDTNYILRSAQKLNNSFGLDSKLLHVCNVCGLDYNSNFRTTSEFFGPSID